MNVRVEYDPRPIRHIAVQCDKCGNWFDGRDISPSSLACEYHIYGAKFVCPLCDYTFGADTSLPDYGIKVKERFDSGDVYKDCKRRKEVWE